MGDFYLGSLDVNPANIQWIVQVTIAIIITIITTTITPTITITIITITIITIATGGHVSGCRQPILRDDHHAGGHRHRGRRTVPTSTPAAAVFFNFF
jgi:hypothetical protein